MFSDPRADAADFFNAAAFNRGIGFKVFLKVNRPKITKNDSNLTKMTEMTEMTLKL